jgi:hypothetical protein
MPEHFDTRDVGYGMLLGRDAAGNTVGCQTIISLCSGCKKPNIRAPNAHDGPSNSGRVGESVEPDQNEKERIERVKFDLNGGFQAGSRARGPKLGPKKGTKTNPIEIK